jgi:hypothetical protein
MLMAESMGFRVYVLTFQRLSLNLGKKYEMIKN